MKGKLAPLLFIAVILFSSCKKRGVTPEGPTDVRIHNLTGYSAEDVTVTTTDDPAYARRTHSYGTVADGALTEYHRFDIAHTEADISLMIDGTLFSTPAADFIYLTYIGPDRITYRVTISDKESHKLKIETIIEEPLR